MMLNEFRDRFSRLKTNITKLRNGVEFRRVPTPSLDNDWKDNNGDEIEFDNDRASIANDDFRLRWV